MIAKRIKELNEKRDAKQTEARALVEKAHAEKREMNADELTKIEGLNAEAELIVRNLVAETRQMAIESQKVDLSKNEERDIGSFDYSKLLNHLVRSAKGAGGPIDGVEGEMIQEGEREARSSGVQSAGLILPRCLVRSNRERRDMTATGQTATAGDQGGQTIATNKAALLDDFFNASVMRAAGATVLEGLTGNLDVPRIVAGTAAAGKAENGAADEVTPTTAMVQFSPKRLPAYIDISEQLLKQSSSAVESVLRSHLTNQMLATQEAAFFHGTGTYMAKGIAGVSGIGSVVGGENGAAPTFAHLIGLETAVDTSNALLGNLRYISNGQIRGKLKQTLRNPSGTDASFILADNGLINGYAANFTNAVSRTLTKGNQSLSSAIFFGNFADYWITYWSGISLELVRDKTNAIGGLYTLVASTYYDGNVVRPKSFSAMLDALGA